MKGVKEGLGSRDFHGTTACNVSDAGIDEGKEGIIRGERRRKWKRYHCMENVCQSPRPIRVKMKKREENSANVDEKDVDKPDALLGVPSNVRVRAQQVPRMRQHLGLQEVISDIG